MLFASLLLFGFYSIFRDVYEPIREKISVIGLYAQGKLIPKKFLWNNKEFLIDQVTFVAEIKDASIRKRHYTVIVKNIAYRLLFDRTEEIWVLEEVWSD